jgi:shikimate kinase
VVERREAGPHVVLVGLMGAGKTTIGSRLARRLDRPFLDSDVQVEQRAARTVRQIFETEGEAAFRALETEVLAEALAVEEPTVIAAAGGTVLDPRNRERMRAAGVVFFLDVPPEVLGGRVGGNDHRPLLGDDPHAALQQMEDTRRDLYLEVADHVIEVGKDSPDVVVDHLLELVAP